MQAHDAHERQGRATHSSGQNAPVHCLSFFTLEVHFLHCLFAKSVGEPYVPYGHCVHTLLPADADSLAPFWHEVQIISTEVTALYLPAPHFSHFGATHGPLPEHVAAELLPWPGGQPFTGVMPIADCMACMARLKSTDLVCSWQGCVEYGLYGAGDGQNVLRDSFTLRRQLRKEAAKTGSQRADKHGRGRESTGTRTGSACSRACRSRQSAGRAWCSVQTNS